MLKRRLCSGNPDDPIELLHRVCQTLMVECHDRFICRFDLTKRVFIFGDERLSSRSRATTQHA